MTAVTLRATLVRALRLLPTLLRRDPLFRTAAIAAALLLILLLGRLAQDAAGPGAIPAPPSAIGTPAAPGTTASPASSAASSAPTSVPTIAPGQRLEGVTVAPAVPDRFGTLPPHAKP